MEQAPAVDIVAIGLQSGQIIVHNLRLDRTLMRFSQDGGPVTALSFRSDAHPFLASSSTLGHISLWDLERRRLATVLSDCHAGTVSGMRFLQSRPMMLTSGTDNALKVPSAPARRYWIRYRCRSFVAPNAVNGFNHVVCRKHIHPFCCLPTRTLDIPLLPFRPALLRAASLPACCPSPWWLGVVAVGV